MIIDLNCQTIESQNWDRHLNQIHAKGILGKIPGTSLVHETSHVTILIPMKIVKHSSSGNDEVMNEGSNDDVKMGSDSGTDLKMNQGVSFLDLKWDNEPMIVDNDSKSKSSQWLLLSMMLAKSLMLELLKLLAPWLISTSKLFLKLMGNQMVKLS